MKQVKKFLCGVLMVCMILDGINVAPQSVQAATASGNDGEIHWEIKGDTLTLSAVKGTKGRMKSFIKSKKKIYIDNGQDYYWDIKYRDAPWQISSASSNIKNIVIDKSISKLESGAFCCYGFNPTKYEYNSMKILCEVDEIPTGFVSQMSIKQITLGDSIKMVHAFAFSNVPVKQLVVGKYTTVNDANFIWSADGSYTNLQTVYTYSGSSAEKMVNNFIKYAMETKETGGVTSTDQDWNGTYFGILDENGEDVYSIDIIYLDKSSSLSEAKATSSISLKKGKSQTIKITLPTGFTKVTKYSGNPADVKVTFKSSNPKVATVSSSGKVTGKKKGSTKITVTMQIKNGTKNTVTTKVTIK